MDWLTFSHAYCTTICAVLLPANVLAMVMALFWVRQSYPIWQVAIPGMLLAYLLILHALSWVIVGMVMGETYLLISLGSVSFGINGLALARPELINQWSKQLIPKIFS